jgi:hypothetical protein
MAPRGRARESYRGMPGALRNLSIRGSVAAPDGSPESRQRTRGRTHEAGCPQTRLSASHGDGGFERGAPHDVHRAATPHVLLDLGGHAAVDIRAPERPCDHCHHPCESARGRQDEDEQAHDDANRDDDGDGKCARPPVHTRLLDRMVGPISRRIHGPECRSSGAEPCMADARRAAPNIRYVKSLGLGSRWAQEPQVGRDLPGSCWTGRTGH